MKLLPIIGALLCALALAGATCTQRDGVTVLPPEKPRLDRPDSWSMEKCAWPVIPKVRPMSQEDTEALLGANADRQIACIHRHDALVNFIRTRDDGLSGRAATGAFN